MRLTSLPQTLKHESLARRTGPARRLSSDELMIATKFIRFYSPIVCQAWELSVPTVTA